MRTRLNKRTAAPFPALASAVDALRAAPWMPPFRVRLRDLTAEGILGACTRGPAGVFTIFLHQPLALSYPSAAIVILAHEAAHALSWPARGQSDHGPAFGRAYARVWRHLHSSE